MSSLKYGTVTAIVLEYCDNAGTSIIVGISEPEYSENCTTRQSEEQTTDPSWFFSNAKRKNVNKLSGYNIINVQRVDRRYPTNRQTDQPTNRHSQL